MLLDHRLVAGLAGLLAAARVNAAAAATCSSNLLIDDFTQWTSGVNSLNSQNGGRSLPSPSPPPRTHTEYRS